MATDIVDIGLRVDSKQVKKGREELKKFGGQSKEANTATGNLNKGFGGLGATAKILAGSLAAVGAISLFTSAIRETIEFEKNLNVIDRLVQQTGASAWTSGERLRTQAEAIGLSTLESVKGVQEAQKTLLTFRSVMGQEFDRAIMAAADMSAALGIDLKGATLQLGKALEDPVKGLTALSRSGTVFTDQQKEMVSAMVEAGETAEAQRFILSELEAQYGGAGKAAAQGMAGAIDTLSQRWSEFKINLVEDSSGGITSVILGIADGVVFLDKTVQSVVLAFADMGNAIGAIAAAAGQFLSFNFAAGKQILELREQEKASNEEKLAAIWAEKEAELDLSSTKLSIAEQEAITQVARDQQRVDAAARRQEELLLERELLNELFLEEELNEAIRQEQELERIAEHNDKKLAADRDYYERLFDLETGSLKAANDFAIAIRNQDVKSIIDTGALALSNVAKNSKKMFEVQKAFALAKAIATLPSAVIQSYENAGGFPFGIVPAGLMLAAGLQQINAIRSSSFGGGGSVPSVSSSTSPSAPAGDLPPGSTSLPDASEIPLAPPTRELVVTVESDGPHSDGMRAFAENLAETLKDMGSNTSIVIS